MSDLETTIGNRALQRLGVARVSSFADPSKAARALSANYAPARDALLAAHPWSFAIVRTSLQLDATVPAWGYNGRFTLPGDCLSVIEIQCASRPLGLEDYRDGPDAPYAVESGFILTDLPAPLNIRYLQAVTSGFHPLFSDALAWALAVDLADELTQSATKLQIVQAGLKQAMALARQRNAIEKPSEGVQDDSWVLGRL